MTGSVTFQSPRGDGDEKAFDGGIMGVVRKRLKGMGKYSGNAGSMGSGIRETGNMWVCGI